MVYVLSTRNPSGAYANPVLQRRRNTVALTQDQAEVFFSYNGFVEIETEQGEDGLIAASVTPNTEAWEVWQAEVAANPAQEPEPSPEERLAALESAMLAVMMGGNTNE